VIAAVVPSLLYYFGLMVQLDAVAVRQGIKGLPPEEIPDARKILRQGWPFIVVFLVLVYFLYLRMEQEAPYYAILFVLACLMLRRETRVGLAKLWDLLIKTSQSISDLTVTIGAVGFIIGAMSLTGVGTSISGELVALAGGNVYLMLLFGAMASFVLGMGMTTSACYIFLAIVLAPGLVSQGFNQICVHMFILYWAMISNITPPVAMACFPAAAIAEAPYMKVGLSAVSFGFVIYIIPFIFVLQPAMLFQNPDPLACLYYIGTAFVGVFILASALGRNMVGVGHLSAPVAAVMGLFGLGLAWPFPPAITAVALAGLVVLSLMVRRRNLSRSGVEAGPA